MAGDPPPMRNRKSKLLRDVIADMDQVLEKAKARKFVLRGPVYPFNCREAVFCWLWANHAEVTNLRTRWDYITWKGIAMIMQEDGVKGWKGEPPNANSVRRVWGRVCREVEEREAWEATELESVAPAPPRCP
jgi:hypothetical protein